MDHNSRRSMFGADPVSQDSGGRIRHEIFKQEREIYCHMSDVQQIGLSEFGVNKK